MNAIQTTLGNSIEDCAGGMGKTQSQKMIGGVAVQYYGLRHEKERLLGGATRDSDINEGGGGSKNFLLRL